VGTTGRLPFGWGMTSANLNASSMMIADMASDLIRGNV
jgi:hypothetical protein